MATLDFYFDFRSPYSYLANTQLRSLGGVDVNYRPVDVMAVMKQVGNTPTTVVCAVKGRYARADLQRWAQRYGVPLQRQQDPRAIDARRLLRAVLKAGDGGQAGPAVDAIFSAMWATGAALVTPADVAAVLNSGGVDVAAADLDEASADQRLTEATHAAGELGVFGAPTFVTGGEMFFGNDRLDFVREHLAKQR